MSLSCCTAQEKGTKESTESFFLTAHINPLQCSNECWTDVEACLRWRRPSGATFTGDVVLLSLPSADWRGQGSQPRETVLFPTLARLFLSSLNLKPCRWPWLRRKLPGMSVVYVLLRAQTKPCRRVSCGCSECVEDLWILFAGVGEQGAALQAVSASPVLHMGGHISAGLASRLPYRKLGRGVGWQHDHRQENQGPHHTPSEHEERQRQKKGSMHLPLWSNSWTRYPKGRSLPSQAPWETPDSREWYGAQRYPAPPQNAPGLLRNSFIFLSACI